jgi:hypothetical protein
VMQRRGHIKRTNTLPRSPFNPKKGKKVLWWERTRRGLKKEFERAGLTSCEARFDGCRVDDELGFAHTSKRRHITNEAEMREVAILCNRCHDRAEMQGEAKMQVIIRDIIAKREAA